MTERVYKYEGEWLTARDVEFLQFVIAYADKNPLGRPPTHREVAEHFGFVSKEQSFRHSSKMKRLRLFMTGEGVAGEDRNMVPTPEARRILGEIARGHKGTRKP